MGREAAASLINYLKMLGQNSFIIIIVVVIVMVMNRASNCICAWNVGCYFDGVL